MSFQGDSSSGPFGISTQTLQSANQNWVSEAFTNGEYTPFYMSFEIAPCGYGLTCDFQDTAQVSLALPTGVSYTSDSGAFLSSPTTPVPEPGTFTLLAVGAVGAAFARRRQILTVFLSKSFSKSPNCGRHTGLASV